MPRCNHGTEVVGTCAPIDSSVSFIVWSIDVCGVNGQTLTVIEEKRRRGETVKDMKASAAGARAGRRENLRFERSLQAACVGRVSVNDVASERSTVTKIYYISTFVLVFQDASLNL
ncbi:uncharacterized protein [Physcomitrium patens]|uniref:Uncharacterized protein n=1 Tax=Physcomitrium patens TaxID=3218 RepID=A0A7I4AHK4_PHYPA